MSAQTSDIAVNAATAELFKVARTPAALAALGVDGVIPYIKKLGFYNMKAKNLVEMARLLNERHAGEVPRDADLLTELPGIGRKSANVLLNAIWGEAVIGVDTHVQRVANRIGICDTKDVVATERVLMARTEPRHLQHADAWLTLFGRYACKAKKPVCPRCPIASLCVYPDKTADDGAPAPDAPLVPPPVRPF
jgi:endonuclease-3